MGEHMTLSEEKGSATQNRKIAGIGLSAAYCIATLTVGTNQLFSASRAVSSANERSETILREEFETSQQPYLVQNLEADQKFIRAINRNLTAPNGLFRPFIDISRAIDVSDVLTTNKYIESYYMTVKCEENAKFANLTIREAHDSILIVNKDLDVNTATEQARALIEAVRIQDKAGLSVYGTYTLGDDGAVTYSSKEPSTDYVPARPAAAPKPSA